MELVNVKKNKVFCDTNMVAKKFGMEHKKVIRSIERLEKEIIGNDLGGPAGPLKFTKEIMVYRGQEYTGYSMDKTSFMFLAMRFKTKKAFEWQLKFIKAFDLMEQKLLQEEINKNNSDWLDVRNHGKLIRRETTDVIKDFIEYADTQGSSGSKWYYKHYTNATYGALGLLVNKKPKLRDTLNILEISELVLAENFVRKSIEKYMCAEMAYKKIYSFVKNDLIDFCKTIKLVTLK